MVWPIYALFGAVLMLASDWRHRSALALIIGGLVAVYAAKLGLSDAAFWVLSSVIWVIFGGIIGMQGNRNFALAGLLLVVAGLCVLPARLMGLRYEIGNPFLVLSDVLGVGAILCLGWPGLCRIGRGIAGMVRRFGFGFRRAGAAFVAFVAQEN